MCIITYNFVADAKYNMGSLIYRPSWKEIYVNIMFTTNLFGKSYDTYYLDEKGIITHGLVNKHEKKDKELEDYELIKIDGNNNLSIW